MNDTIQQLQSLDEFTRKTIVLEFPEIFPEYTTPKLDTESIDHFKVQFTDLHFLAIFAIVTVIVSVIL